MQLLELCLGFSEPSGSPGSVLGSHGPVSVLFLPSKHTGRGSRGAFGAQNPWNWSKSMNYPNWAGVSPWGRAQPHWYIHRGIGIGGEGPGAPQSLDLVGELQGNELGSSAGFTEAPTSPGCSLEPCPSPAPDKSRRPSPSRSCLWPGGQWSRCGPGVGTIPADPDLNGAL